MTGRSRAETHLRARLTRSRELHQLMRWWRHRLRLDGMAAQVSAGRRPVTQRVVAQLVGVSLLWYGRLERGERDQGYSGEVLERVAITLRLDEHERCVLYLLLDRQPDPSSPRENAMNAGSRWLFVDRHGDPSFVVDPVWNTIHANRAMHDLFPHLDREPNLIRWALNDEQARHQLVDWKSFWVPGILALLRGAHARWPDNEELKDLIVETLLANPYAKSLWDNQPRVRMHADGVRCRIRSVNSDVVHHMEIMASPLWRGEGLQLVALAPLDP